MIARIKERRISAALYVAATVILSVFALPLDAIAQSSADPSVLSLSVDPSANSESLADSIKIILTLTAIALAPSILIAMTSFTRIIIVLSMLRQAFGMQDTPPNMVLISLALFLTLFTMGSVFSSAYSAGVQPLIKEEISIEEAGLNAIAPFRDFMTRQTRERDLELILDVAETPIPDTIADVRTIHIVPAFLLSELKTAFQIGFIIFLPFLLLDIVVASVLMSMGMLMVPPTIISLPLKVMMFVLIDGWAICVEALLGSFR